MFLKLEAEMICLRIVNLYLVCDALCLICDALLLLLRCLDLLLLLLSPVLLAPRLDHGIEEEMAPPRRGLNLLTYVCKLLPNTILFYFYFIFTF